jgi:hypothetical protein
MAADRDENLHFALLVGAGLLPKKRVAELARANPPDRVPCVRMRE